MNTDLKEVIDSYYTATSEEYWYECEECGAKVYARPADYSDLALHEVRAHPER